MYFDGCSRVKVVIEKTEMAEVFGNLHVNRFFKKNMGPLMCSYSETGEF